MADVTLPQLGETVTEGTITQWFKNVGDVVSADEPLFEVSTDKVDTEVPSPVSGIVAEIRVAEGDTIDVGTIVAVVSADGAAAAPAPAPESAPAPAPAPEPAPAPAPAPEPEPAPAPTPEAAPTPAPAPAATPAPAVSERTPAANDSRLLSPVVRRLVNEHGIDSSALVGTGPGGRVTREDVLDHLDKVGSAPANRTPVDPAPAPVVATAPAQPAPPAHGSTAVSTGGRETVIPLSKIRQLTGDHMVASKSTSPHAFSVVEVDFANVDRVRSSVKAEFRASEGFSLTYLPFIARALVDGLQEFPNLNASVVGTDLVVHGYIDLGIAVDLDYQGLIAPVIRGAETKRLKAIAQEIHDLADRARNRRLSPDEIQGGTFTISNNGSAGSVLTMPIINQPQVGIVSTDAIVRKPVVANLADGGEAIVVHPVGNLAMSWDHRAFDGAYAAGFLLRVKEILENRDWAAEL